MYTHIHSDMWQSDGDIRCKWNVFFPCAALEHCTLPQRSERGQRDQDDPGEEGTGRDETVKQGPWMHSFSHTHTWTLNLTECSLFKRYYYESCFTFCYTFVILWKICAATECITQVLYNSHAISWKEQRTTWSHAQNFSTSLSPGTLLKWSRCLMQLSTYISASLPFPHGLSSHFVPW